MPSTKTVLLAGAGLLLAACRSCEPGRPHVRAPAAPVQDRPAVLAILPEDPAPVSSVADHGSIGYQFGERGGGVAWTAQVPGQGYRVLYDGRPGPTFEQVTEIALSPDGLHHAYAGLAEGRWHVLRDGKDVGVYAEVGRMVFSPDGAHLMGGVKVGEEFRMLVDGEPVRTAPGDYLDQDFTADSSKAVISEPVDAERARVVVVDLRSRAVTVVEESAVLLVRSDDRSRFAIVATVERGMRVVSFDADRPDRVHAGKRYERVAGVDFGVGGVPLAYFALRAGETLLVVEDDEVPLQKGEEVVGGAAIRPGERGFGALVRSQGTVTFRQFLAPAAPEEPRYEEAFGLAYGAGGRYHAYAARRGDRWFVVVNGKEGPPMDAVRPPEFSADGRFLVYRARREGRRFVVVAEADGRRPRELPAYEQVFEVRFTADGRSIAYGVKDGRELAWKVDPL